MIQTASKDCLIPDVQFLSFIFQLEEQVLSDLLYGFSVKL